MKQIHITFLYGLPGSGKTTWTIDQFKFVTYIDVDNFVRSFHTRPNDLDNKIANNIFNRIRHCEHGKRVIVDGLFTTNDYVKRMMDLISEEFKKRVLGRIVDNTEPIFSIEWWGEDRQACLQNDKDRRKESSTLSIQNLKFEIPDAKFLGIAEKRIMKHHVYKKSPAQLWLDELVLEDDEFKYRIDTVHLILRSDEWCLGGTCGSYDGQNGTVDAEPPPEFDLLDELLYKAIPNLSFLEYKKIRRECVELKDKSEHDYYGGERKNAWYECDLNKLYNIIGNK